MAFVYKSINSEELYSPSTSSHLAGKKSSLNKPEGQRYLLGERAPFL